MKHFFKLKHFIKLLSNKDDIILSIKDGHISDINFLTLENNFLNKLFQRMERLEAFSRIAIKQIQTLWQKKP